MNKRKDLPLSYVYAALVVVLIPPVFLWTFLTGLWELVVTMYQDNRSLFSDVRSAPAMYVKEAAIRRSIRARRRAVGAKV
jgi:hypothetical protein